MLPKYKYNIDDIVNMDPFEIRRLQHETQEALLEEFMPSDPKDFLYKVGEYHNFNKVSNKSGDMLTQD
jgi:hypothetical protein